MCSPQGEKKTDSVVEKVSQQPLMPIYSTCISADQPISYAYCTDTDLSLPKSYNLETFTY
jgi:hypothetical protein